MVPALTPPMTSYSRFSFTLYLGSQLRTGRCLNKKPLSFFTEHLMQTNKHREEKKSLWFSCLFVTCLNVTWSHSYRATLYSIKASQRQRTCDMKQFILTVWSDGESVPEVLLHSLSDGELSSLLVKLSVKVWEVVSRSVNHISGTVLRHGCDMQENIKTTENSLSCYVPNLHKSFKTEDRQKMSLLFTNHQDSFPLSSYAGFVAGYETD